MSLIPFAILATIGVATWAISELSDWGEEKERLKIKRLKRRREMLNLKYEANIRKDAKHFLQKLVKLEKKEQTDIYTKLDKLRAERANKIKVDLLDPKLPNHHNLRLALWQFDDIIEEKYADAYSITLFIDEAYRRIEVMYGNQPSSRSASWARSLDKSGFLDNISVPLKGTLIKGIVHAPSTNLWFELDAKIKGVLSNQESTSKLTTGSSKLLFIESINYSLRQAVVSIQKAKFLKSQKKITSPLKAKVLNTNQHGTQINISGVKGFIPKSFLINRSLSSNELLVKLVEVEPKLRSIIAKPI